MDPGYYVAAGSLKARAFQLEVVANNLANAATVGYKPDQAFFAVFNKAAGSGRKLPLSGYLNDGVVFAETGVVTEQGNLRATGRPLVLAVQTPAGIRVTRDGRVQMGVDGQLQAADGSPLLGKNGQPIKVDPKNGIISISVDGSVSQKGQVLGQLDLKAYEKPSALKRTGALRFDPTGADPGGPAEGLRGGAGEGDRDPGPPRAERRGFGLHHGRDDPSEPALRVEPEGGLDPHQ